MVYQTLLRFPFGTEQAKFTCNDMSLGLLQGKVYAEC